MLMEHKRNYALGMDALVRNYALGMDASVTVCSWNTNGIMLWAWMLWSPYALGTRTELCFGHECSCSPYALGTRTESCLGHGCSGHRIVLEHERNYALGMDALVTACSWNTNGIMHWAWMLLSPHALGTRTELCIGHGCSCHRILLEHKRNYALGMDALVTVCSWNTNGIMHWAWMLWSPYALGTGPELCFGHGCSCHRMLFEHERNYALGTNALAHRMLLEHERNYALGMDALVTA